MKEPKAMTYEIEPIRKLLISEALSDGGTQKKADELEGQWIRLNEHDYVLEEADKLTRVYIDEKEYGCACKSFSDQPLNVLCEHILAFKNLKSPPQLTIESQECRWLQTYLLGLEWYPEQGYLYPPMESPSNEPEVVAELPPIDEKLDPVNEDKPLDTEVDDEPKPKEYSRKCNYCGHIERGGDIIQVKQQIEEHRKTCQKNPANMNKNPRPVTQEVPETTVAKPAPVESPSKEDKPTTMTKKDQVVPAVRKKMPTEAEFQTAAVGRILRNQGSIYKVSGKDVADSAAVSNYAISAGVSTETVVLEQTTEYARATVRAHKGTRHTEGSVLIRKDAILEKIVIDLAEKNPDWITGWSNALPEFDLDQVIHVGDKRTVLGLHIVGTLIDKWTFASRDCETKAGRRAMIKILGADWREDDEVESEVEEMKTVANKR